MIDGKLIVREYNQDSIEDLVKNHNSLVLFYADWCHYCKNFFPLFEKLDKEIDNSKILLGGVKLNDDYNPLWDKYQINAVPTLIAFSDGSVKCRKDAKMGVGLTQKDLDDIVLEIMEKRS